MAVLLAGILHLAAGVAAARAEAPQAGSGSALTPQIAARIVAHGPWPPAPAAGVGDLLSGNADAIALGRRLFFDARLSPSGRIACSSCHRPERGWTDGLARSRGLAEGQRNTPSLYDVRLHERFGWTGQGASLWQQSMRPILDPAEMGGSAAHARSHIIGTPDLAALFAKVGGSLPSDADPETALETAARALAAFQETIASARTAFDGWRDDVAAGRDGASTRYPAAAQRGASLFVGVAGCNRCHSGPAFSDGALHVLAKGGHVAIRTPGLRQLSRTAPYMHDGSAATIPEAITAHALKPALQPAQVADLAAFLATLSDATRR